MNILLEKTSLDTPQAAAPEADNVGDSTYRSIDAPVIEHAGSAGKEATDTSPEIYKSIYKDPVEVAADDLAGVQHPQNKPGVEAVKVPELSLIHI